MTRRDRCCRHLSDSPGLFWLISTLAPRTGNGQVPTNDCRSSLVVVAALTRGDPLEQSISGAHSARTALGARVAAVLTVVLLALGAGALAAGTAEAAPGGYQAVHGRAYACGNDR